MSINIKKFRKQAKLVEEIRVNWNVKMKELQTKGFEEKELVSVKKDVCKLRNLNFLKSQDIPGPLASAEDVEDFMEKVSESITKKKRMYVEVRYAKQTCLSISNHAKYFRLRRDGKNLDTGDYPKCLKDYLSTSKSVGKLIIPYLRNVLGGL